MSRFLTVVASVIALLVGGLITLAFLLPPEHLWLLAPAIIVVVLGVNITAWLVIPRIIHSMTSFSSVLPPTPPSGWRLARTDRGGDWSFESSSESESEAWSSSWDYAGGDGPDGGDDERWADLYGVSGSARSGHTGFDDHHQHGHSGGSSGSAWSGSHDASGGCADGSSGSSGSSGSDSSPSSSPSSDSWSSSSW